MPLQVLFITYCLLLAQGVQVEKYDLRGQGYTNEQIAATARAYSENKLVLVVHVNRDNPTYQKTVLDIVGDQVRAGRDKIIVLLTERKAGTRNAVYVFAKKELLVTVYGDASDYGLTLAKTLKEAYTQHL